MFSKVLLLSLILLSASSCATVEQPSSRTVLAPATQTPATSGIAHVVQPGETLWRISKTYHADLDDILRANRILDSSVVAAGSTIIIPVAEKTAAATNFTGRGPETDFVWPVRGKVITRFKERSDGVLNKGIDIQTQPSSDVVASQSGTVAFVGTLTGYGPTLIIEHGDGLSTVYCGNSRIIVKTGDSVQQGAVVAKTADPAQNGRRPLHFEVRRKQKPQNPLYYLKD